MGLKAARPVGPVHEGAVRRKLMATIADLQPQTIVFVGDVVHASRPGPQERAAIEATLGELAAHSELVLIPGNHDRGFHTDYPGAAIRLGSEWRENGLLAVHGHILPKTTDHLIVGHIHPALGIVDHAGATQKLPVFVASERLTVLPAFSPLSAGRRYPDAHAAALGEMLEREYPRDRRFRQACC